MRGRDLNQPSELGLIFDKWRPQQEEAISWLGDNPIQVLEAPTGTGKTGVILGYAQENPQWRFLILCATKLEQEQYMKIHNSVDTVSVKGKNNFHCGVLTEGVFDGFVEEECFRENCTETHIDEAPCQSGLECEFQGKCSYFVQRDRARNSRVVITSYPMGLNMLNLTKGLGAFDVIVEDEGHVLDSMLESFLSITISRQVLKQVFNIDVKNKTNFPYWKKNTFILEQIQSRLGQLESSLEKYSVRSNPPPTVLVRHIQTAERYIKNLKRIQALDSFNWLMEDEGGPIKFTPVWTTDESERVLFGHSKRHIIMSGTIPSPKMLSKKIGLSTDNFDFKRLPYVFPVENRRIILKPSVDLTYKNKQQGLPVLVEETNQILSQYTDRKILIHTVSYEIQKYLMANSMFQNQMMGHDSRNRVEVLNRFKESYPMSILVSPSFDKAVDLPGDECECIIICKLPWPNLASPVIQRRMKSDRDWYEHECLSSLLQMVGRGNRTETDVCDIYILDKSIKRFLSKVHTNKDFMESIKEGNGQLVNLHI